MKKNNKKLQYLIDNFNNEDKILLMKEQDSDIMQENYDANQIVSQKCQDLYQFYTQMDEKQKIVSPQFKKQYNNNIQIKQIKKLKRSQSIQNLSSTNVQFQSSKLQQCDPFKIYHQSIIKEFEFSKKSQLQKLLQKYRQNLHDKNFVETMTGHSVWLTIRKMCFISEMLSDIEFSQGKYQQAEDILLQAKQLTQPIFNNWNWQNKFTWQSFRIHILIKLAQIYLQQNEYVQTYNYIQQQLDQIRDDENLDKNILILSGIENLYMIMAECANKLGNLKESIAFRVLAINLINSFIKNYKFVPEMEFIFSQNLDGLDQVLAIKKYIMAQNFFILGIVVEKYSKDRGIKILEICNNIVQKACGSQDPLFLNLEIILQIKKNHHVQFNEDLLYYNGNFLNQIEEYLIQLKQKGDPTYQLEKKSSKYKFQKKVNQIIQIQNLLPKESESKDVSQKINTITNKIWFSSQKHNKSVQKEQQFYFKDQTRDSQEKWYFDFVQVKKKIDIQKLSYLNVIETFLDNHLLPEKFFRQEWNPSLMNVTSKELVSIYNHFKMSNKQQIDQENNNQNQKSRDHLYFHRPSQQLTQQTTSKSPLDQNVVNFNQLIDKIKSKLQPIDMVEINQRPSSSSQFAIKNQGIKKKQEPVLAYHHLIKKNSQFIDQPQQQQVQYQRPKRMIKSVSSTNIVKKKDNIKIKQQEINDDKDITMNQSSDKSIVDILYVYENSQQLAIEYYNQKKEKALKTIQNFIMKSVRILKTRKEQKIQQQRDLQIQKLAEKLHILNFVSKPVISRKGSKEDDIYNRKNYVTNFKMIVNYQHTEENQFPNFYFYKVCLGKNILWKVQDIKIQYLKQNIYLKMRVCSRKNVEFSINFCTKTEMVQSKNHIFNWPDLQHLLDLYLNSNQLNEISTIQNEQLFIYNEVPGLMNYYTEQDQIQIEQVQQKISQKLINNLYLKSTVIGVQWRIKSHSQNLKGQSTQLIFVFFNIELHKFICYFKHILAMISFSTNQYKFCLKQKTLL